MKPSKRPRSESSVRRERHAMSSRLSLREACPTIPASEARTASCSVVRLTRVPPYGIVTSAMRSVGASLSRNVSAASRSGRSVPTRNESLSTTRTNARDSRVCTFVPNGGGSGDTAVGCALPATSTRLIAVRGRARPPSFNETSSALRSGTGWPSRPIARKSSETRLIPLLSGGDCAAGIEASGGTASSTIGRARRSNAADNMRGRIADGR